MCDKLKEAVALLEEWNSHPPTTLNRINTSLSICYKLKEHYDAYSTKRDTDNISRNNRRIKQLELQKKTLEFIESLENL